MTLTIGSLFSGIGGLELGLERAGLGPVVWQVEREPYCRAVLAKHWPDAARFDDVCTVGAHTLAPVDVICGGFPCQDISATGRGAGIDGPQSGLWREYARIIREVRPRYVVVENTAALLGRGAGRVLGDLAALGYDAEWSVLSACAVGAPHMRERLFVLGYADEIRRDGRSTAESIALAARRRASGVRPWADLSGVHGTAYGLPGWLDRVAALGNAVVPQVAEVVGRLIVAREQALREAAA